MIIFGVTGTDGSGKGTVVEYLIQHHGFVHYSARALWVEEIERRGLPVTRANMRLIANDLRKLHGRDYLITECIRQAREKNDVRIVIDSLRATAEAQRLHTEGGTLLAVDADQKLRYERIQERKSVSDSVSFDEFVSHEKIEMNDPDPNGMQKEAVIAIADYTITNNGTLEELHAYIEDVLQKVGV